MNAGAGHAGIRVTGVNNRIEGNNLTRNGTGIDVESEGNLIIKNFWRGNTVGYSIVANNTVGPVYGEEDPIIGTNPWANFKGTP